MLKLLLLAATLAWSAPTTAAHAAETIVVGGVARSYKLTTPKLLGRSPLVVVLHGHGGNAEQVARYAGWDRLAAERRLAVAYPNAIGGDWQLPGSATGVTRTPDTAFIDKLIQTLVSNGTADPRRIYITGLSEGGAMAYSMVCVRAQRFAAAAPVITGSVEGFERACRPYRPVPMLFMNGTADKRVPYEGGLSNGGVARYPFLSTPRFVDAWRTINGCRTGNAGQEQLSDLDRRDGTTTTVFKSDCPARADVVLYRVNGGGHQQPARPATIRPGPVDTDLGPQGHDFDGAETIWAFFERFAL